MINLIENAAAIFCVIMMGFIIWLVAGMTVFAESDPPPVEVHIQESDNLFMYDCYRANITGPPKEESMMVYINFPQGIAGYECDYEAGAHIIPLLPKHPDVRISFFSGSIIVVLLAN